MIESSPRKRAWRRTSRRVHWLALGLSACVGGISDPDRFGDGTSCPSDLRIEELFEVSCAGGACHGADASPAGGLDLVTPGFAERMIGVPSEICGWMDLVVPGDAEESFLFVKVTNPPLSCGDPMPPVSYLTRNEVRCVRDWIESLGGDDAGVGGDADTADAGQEPDEAPSGDELP